MMATVLPRLTAKSRTARARKPSNATAPATNAVVLSEQQEEEDASCPQ